jgi:hypothetical protein
VLSNFAPDLVAAPGRLVAARDILGDAALEVRYEDLATTPEDTLRALCEFLRIEFDAGMLNYSDTPAPVGRMNDPVGIHQHTAPSTGSLDKWTQLGADGQLRHFALQYLEALGDSTVSELGYDAAELRARIEQTTIEKPARHVYPWRLAITPRRRWNLRDHIASAYLLAAQSRGRMAGLVAALKILWRRIGGGFWRLAEHDDNGPR